jgi:hypothetical protein
MRKRESKEQKRESHKNKKLIVIKKYGGCCVFCKDTELAILTIDHKNNNGAADRKRFSCSRAFYHELRVGQPRSDLQVLCFNCQWRKRIYGDDITKWDSLKTSTEDEPKKVRKYNRSVKLVQ